MATNFEGLPKTPNLKLNKPGYDNVADIEALNENSDILDEEINTIKSNLKNKGSATEPIYFDGNGVPQKTKNFNDYLPLAGGTMTGAIETDGDIINPSNNNTFIRIKGSKEYQQGAELLLSGKTLTEHEGLFYLIANNGTKSTKLLGKADGNLLWGAKHIARSVNGINATPDGNIDLGITTIAKGGTGATTANQACANIGALPTSGGTMSGVITSNNLTFANKKNNSEYFEVIGATDSTNGAFLQLYGKDNTVHPNSEFILGNISCDLKGDSTGDLKWSGKNLYVDGELIYNGDTNNNQRGLELPARNINNHGGSIILNAYTGLCSVQIDNFNNNIRFIGRTPSDHWASGNLADIWAFSLNKFGNGQGILGEGYIAKGDNYIKYASGLIIQWGAGYNLYSGSAINFSIPFSNTNYTFATSSHDSNGYVHSMNILTMSNTGVTISSSNYPAGCRWIAIGY